MAKVFVLPNRTDSSLSTLAELSIPMLSSVSSDNPRRRGFKGLVVDAVGDSAYMRGFYAKPNGRPLRWYGDSVFASSESNSPLVSCYNRFVRMPTWRKDKVVIPVRPQAYKLLERVSRKTGGFGCVSSLDEISGFESEVGTSMLQDYDIMDVIFGD